MNGHDAFFGEISKGAKGKLAAAGAAAAGGGLAVGVIAHQNKKAGRKWNQGAPPDGGKGMSSNEWSFNAVPGKRARYEKKFGEVSR